MDVKKGLTGSRGERVNVYRDGRGGWRALRALGWKG